MNLKYSIILFVFLISGCAPRGFSPPPEPYEEFSHKSKQVNLNEIKSSMVACGYLPEWGYSGKPESDNQMRMQGQVARLECMFQNGYYLKSGWGGYCSDPDYKYEIACQNIPSRPRSGYYGQ